MIEKSVSTSSELSCVSVRSQTSRDEKNYYVLTEKDSQLCKCLCSEKLESVKCRVLAW